MKRIKVVLQFRSKLFETLLDAYMGLCVKEIYNENSLAIAYTFFLEDDNQEQDIIELVALYNKRVCKSNDTEADIELVCVYKDTIQEKIYHKSFKPHISEYLNVDKHTFEKATENGVKKFISYKEYTRACNIIGATLAIILIIVMLLYYAIKLRILVA